MRVRGIDTRETRALLKKALVRVLVGHLVDNCAEGYLC